MADPKQAQDALTDTIESLAGKVKQATNSEAALRYAAAANQLAEARAWLGSVAQPHGGFSYSEGK